MLVRVLNSDGTVSTIPNVKWHSGYMQDCGAGIGDRYFPAGLWARKSDVVAHYARVNVERKQSGVPLRELKDVIDNIICGEAELEVYDDVSNEEPWRCNGTLVKTVRYGKDDKWWNNHA